MIWGWDIYIIQVELFKRYGRTYIKYLNISGTGAFIALIQAPVHSPGKNLMTTTQIQTAHPAAICRNVGPQLQDFNPDET
jgi:hypothetical protein